MRKALLHRHCDRSCGEGAKVVTDSGALNTFIMFSTADWAAPYWTNKQHIAERLAMRGHRVLYIESPGIRPPKINSRDLSRIFSRLKRAWFSPRKMRETLWVHAPLTIPMGHKSRIVLAFNGWLLRSTIRKWLKRGGQKPTIIWTYHPYFDDAVRDLDVHSLVYHCVDDLASIPGVDSATFRKAELNLLRHADMVFTTSPRLQEHCAAIVGKRSIYERNVADLEHFSRARQAGDIPPELAAIEGLKLGYTGVLSEYKLDFALIEQCAKSRPDWNWVFIGDEPERQNSAVVARLGSLPNVHFLGYRTYERLPDYLRGIDIAVMPNLTSGYMSSVFPLKLYEYLAAGKPVISTSISALADMGDVISQVDGRDSWLSAIEATVESRPPPIPLEDPRIAERSWDKRLDRMLERLTIADR